MTTESAFVDPVIRLSVQCQIAHDDAQQYLATRGERSGRFYLAELVKAAKSAREDIDAFLALVEPAAPVHAVPAQESVA